MQAEYAADHNVGGGGGGRRRNKKKGGWLRNIDVGIKALLQQASFEGDKRRAKTLAANARRVEELCEEAERKFIDEHTKEEAQGRFRCLLPPFKLFMSPDFVHKHIRNKHSEPLEAARVAAKGKPIAPSSS